MPKSTAKPQRGLAGIRTVAHGGILGLHVTKPLLHRRRRRRESDVQLDSSPVALHLVGTLGQNSLADPLDDGLLDAERAQATL